VFLIVAKNHGLGYKTAILISKFLSSNPTLPNLHLASVFSETTVIRFLKPV